MPLCGGSSSFVRIQGIPFSGPGSPNRGWAVCHQGHTTDVTVWPPSWLLSPGSWGSPGEATRRGGGPADHEDCTWESTAHGYRHVLLTENYTVSSLNVCFVEV